MRLSWSCNPVDTEEGKDYMDLWAFESYLLDKIDQEVVPQFQAASLHVDRMFWSIDIGFPKSDLFIQSAEIQSAKISFWGVPKQ